MRKVDSHFFGVEEENVVKNFVDNIDWKPFHEHLQELGFDTRLEVVTYLDAGKYRLRIRGIDDLTDKTGIMAPCFESVHLVDFGTFLSQSVDYDEDLYQAALKQGEYDKGWEAFDAVFGPIHLFVNIDLRYVLSHSGENGMRLFSAEYNTEDGWLFYDN